MTAKSKLGIVFGGVSSEHEVSLASARNVLGAIDRDRFEVSEIGVLKDGRWVVGDGALLYLVCAADQAKLPVGMDSVIAEAQIRYGVSGSGAQLRSALQQKLAAQLTVSRSRLPEPNRSGQTLADLDVVFPVLHGAMGEDGAIQGLLKIADVAVVGCGILASAVCLDKIICKQILAYHGVTQARWIDYRGKYALAHRSEVETAINEKLGGYPVFLKPANGGSSVGISKVKSRDDLEKALRLAAEYDLKVIIEEAIVGREVEIAVLGADELEVSPVASEIIPEREFYDYEAKYLDGGTKIELPAKLPPGVVDRMKGVARQAFSAVDGCGMARIDFFYREASDELFLNEINTIPGFTQISQYPALMKSADYTYGKLIEALIDVALQRHREQQALTI